ncbi:MAG: SDR family NAD(P)-dependent oxidoreductase [Gammaproteobacteria bacterium]|nr:SDR family NAD(P)-dependent oxidoreductase [Gammaproteobacteria bacterium]
MDIKNISVIISGGASGMGAATARLLSSAGAKVTLFDINLAAAKKLAAEINGLAIECDIVDEYSVEKACKIAADTFGPARICINCAGIVRGARIVNQQGVMPLSQFREVININLLGTFNVMRLAVANMISLDPIGESNERGIVINTASIAAFEGQIGQTAYSASKGGIVSLTLPAARELAQFGIRVMAIAPGLVDTPMFETLSTETKKALADSVPFPKRLGHPNEYAQLVRHIIENSMLNGEVIRLDGALRMQAR